jgi:signal transduction histidine kinase
MELQIALIISAILQIIAFLITISLIPKTKFNIAWISISLGFFLMAIRRALEVYIFFYTETTDSLTALNSRIAVIISVSMLVASFYIRKIFEVMNRIHGMRKENEARLLSSIIATEEKERKNFSKELHDGLGPILSSAKMTLSTIDKLNLTPLNIELLRKTENLVNSAIAATGEISGRLTPHLLERYGLRKATESFIRNISTKEICEINFSSNINKQRYAHNTELSIYRICCELINNTLKHARANKISVLLTEGKETIDLKYDDNGIGCEENIKPNTGMGLTNIRSRVSSLSGTIEISSSKNKGFYVHIKLPL